MTPSTSNGAESTAQAVIVLLADINNCMSEIEKNLSAKPEVGRVTRGCDVSRYPGAEWARPDRFSFQGYVDAEMKRGDGFWWSFDLSLRSGKWTLSRDINTQGEYGPEPISDFESVTYDSFSELRAGYAALMSEFVRSAESFAFPPLP